jgi:hypothetical protein
LIGKANRKADRAMKELMKSANFRPRVQTRKGSLAGLGLLGNGLVLALLPFCLFVFTIVAPVYVVFTLVSQATRGKTTPRVTRGALASG